MMKKLITNKATDYIIVCTGLAYAILLTIKHWQGTSLSPMYNLTIILIVLLMLYLISRITLLKADR